MPSGPLASSGLGLKLLLHRSSCRTTDYLGPWRTEFAQNRFHLEVLDDIAWFDITEILESDTAFVTSQYLARIIFKAAQGGNAAVPYHTPIAYQARTGISQYPPVKHH